MTVGGQAPEIGAPRRVSGLRRLVGRGVCGGAVLHGPIVALMVVVDGGVDAGVAVQPGQRLMLGASGTVEYRCEGATTTRGEGTAQTDPDGAR